MAINPNIALAARPVEIADPMAMYGKIAAIQQTQNQNALAQYQLGAAQREEAATNALSQAYQSAYNPETGEIDRNKLRQSLATGGFGAKIPTVEKALGELETQALTRQKTEGELFDTSMKQIRNLWGNVRTPEDAMAVHMATHRDPIINKRLRALGITEEMGRQQILQAAQNPQAFGEFVQRAQLGAEKFMELNKPQLSTKDTGSQLIDRTFSPLTGEIRTISTEKKTMSPDASARLAFDRQKFAWEQANPGYELKEGEDGTIYGVNKRTLQATPVSAGAPTAAPGVASTAAPGAVPTTTPFKGKGQALNESQSNATAFGMRMVDANKLLTDFEKAGVTSGGRIKGAVEGTLTSLVPFQGERLAEGAGAVMNVLPGFMGGPNESQQAYSQAKTNFITAVLRKESGAVISPSEFATEEKKYFPQAGDSDKVIKQKQRARELAIDAIKIQAGPGAKNIKGAAATADWSVVK